MSWSGIALQVAYFGVLSLLAAYGLHRLSLVWIFLGRRPQPAAEAAPQSPPDARWPAVTVQLPVYNERYVVERLLDAACSLRYPPGLLEIQLLDDSTDATAEIASRCVASYRARGVDIHHVRRSARDGYKAGALAEGLRRARGALIAIFDADFIPPADFLLRIVPRFTAPGPGARLGMIQARWEHANRDYSLLTRAQALMLDGHFVIEHGARNRAGRFINFNGTAGVFRRECIEEAGGWQADTLTEDLDLSYRAQLAGWRFEAVPQPGVPAELPVEINALKSQQRRWARGSIQTAVKLLPRVARARGLPLAVKLEAATHLTNNAAYLLLAMLAVLIVPALAARAAHPFSYVLFDLPLFAAGTGSFSLFCAMAQRETRRDWIASLVALPALMAIGVGLCLNNGMAVLEGLAGGRSEFERTPKFNVDGTAARRADWRVLEYRAPASYLVIAEAAFAVYFTSAIVDAAARGWYAALPFLALFCFGFAYVAGMSLAQAVGRRLLTASARQAAAHAR